MSEHPQADTAMETRATYKMQRIVAAAVKLKTGRVIMCVRHMDQVFHKALGVKLGTLEHKAATVGSIQGFVDTQGNFLTRREAWDVAHGAGQIIHDPNWQPGILHSEHIY
jgi:hypothetical protein